VYDQLSGRPRLNWDPVNDGGSSRVAPGEGSSFHFDLGGALARLGGPAQPPTPDTPPPPVPLPTESAAALIAPPIVPPPPAPASVEPLPSRVRSEAGDPFPSEPLTPQRDQVDPPLDPLPRRGDHRHHEPQPPVESPVQQAPSGSQASARRSVFDDLGPAPSTSFAPSFAPTAAPSLGPSPSPTLTTAPSPTVGVPSPAFGSIPMPTVAKQAPGPHPAGGPQSSGATATLVAAAPVLAGGAQPFLPTLPPPTPVVATSPAPLIDHQATAPTDLNALRAAQRRAGRQQRQGKVFGRTLLVLLGIGGLIAAALVFGRPYLYPTEWDPTLTPIVDEIQTERGLEFEHTVGLVAQPAAEYAQSVGRLTFDDAWLDSVPMWRALGIAIGEPSIDSVGAALSARRLAVYDPDADRIYLLADSGAAAERDLRIALERAFAAQHGEGVSVDDQTVTGFTGVSSRQQLATAAVHDHIVGEIVGEPAAQVEPTSASPADAPPDAAPAAPPAPLPLPLEYEITAVEHLGPGVIAAAGLDPAAITFQAALSDELGAALDDMAVSTGAGTLQPGDRALAPPVALGNDDWSLVWGARLPAPSVDRLVDVVIADSYRTIDRTGVICVVGVFETASAADAAFVLSRMEAWATGGPAQSQAVVTAGGDTRVQVVSCDPGPEAAAQPIPGAADALVNRQLERLTG
jgi:hypothetical protein